MKDPVARALAWICIGFIFLMWTIIIGVNTARSQEATHVEAVEVDGLWFAVTADGGPGLTFEMWERWPENRRLDNGWPLFHPSDGRWYGWLNYTPADVACLELRFGSVIYEIALGMAECPSLKVVPRSWYPMIVPLSTAIFNGDLYEVTTTEGVVHYIGGIWQEDAPLFALIPAIQDSTGAWSWRFLPEIPRELRP